MVGGGDRLPAAAAAGPGQSPGYHRRGGGLLRGDGALRHVRFPDGPRQAVLPRGTDERAALRLRDEADVRRVEARATVIGYTQRGAEPTARDSAFAFEAGNLAVRLLRDGISNQVIGMRNNRAYHTSIDTALSETRNFKESLYNLINSL